MRYWMMLKVAVVCLLLQSQSFANEKAYHPNRLLVRYQTAPAAVSLATGAAKVGADACRPLWGKTLPPGKSSSLDNVFLYVFSDSVKRLEAEGLLSRDTTVATVERDYRIELFYDTLFRNQWYLDNTGQSYLGIVRVEGEQNDTQTRKTGIAGADMRWVAAVSATTQRHKTRVGVIDTGVDYKHPELQSRVWHNAGEIPLNGRDDDFNGYADDYYGYDFSGDEQGSFTVSPDADPADQVGHGTHCAGIIAAEGGNGVGIEGIAPDAEIMCIKIFPNALISTMAEAIVYAVDNGAEVINASWGSPYYSSIMEDAVNYAVDHGVLFVAAAGNSGSSTPYFPAKFERAMTIAASDSRDWITYFSTYGPWVDLAAPGQDILSLRAAGTDMYASGGEPLVRIVDSLYYLADGTSMATPMVVGAAAFLLSVAPGLSADSVQRLLEATADDIADPQGVVRPGFDIYAGHGRVNLLRAVQMLAGEFAEVESPGINSLQQGVLTFIGSAYSTAGASFMLQVLPASYGQWIPVALGNADKIRQQLGTWDSSPYDGKTQVRLSIGGTMHFESFIRLVNNPQIEIVSPAEGDTVDSYTDIIGSASVPGFESYEVSFYSDANPKTKNLIGFSNELAYRSRLAEWTVGSLRPGMGTLKLTVNAAGGVVEVTRRIMLHSLIAEGYPKMPPARPHLATAVGNIDDDHYPELVTGSGTGILISQVAENTLTRIVPPIGISCQSAPAMGDLDGDGNDEIVMVTDSGVAVIDERGNSLPGWPKVIETGWQYDSYPTPVIANLDGDSFMEILYVDAAGIIRCWRSSGWGYFHSRDGFFADLIQTGMDREFAGALVPFLFVSDFNDDGYKDVGVLYSAVGRNGMYMFSGKNGRPLFSEKGARVIATEPLFGGVLADFDMDGQAEIAFVQRRGGSLVQIGVSIVEADGTYLRGWPKLLEDKIQWLSPYPVAADLDRDSLPELICVFSALDGGEVYIWHGDGQPFTGNTLGRSDGFLAGTTNSLSNPLVLDVDADGEYEIVSRGGATLIGKPERVFAWELDGTVTRGWPIYTYANPAVVTYSPFTPAAGDFDNDGLLELFMGSSDRQVYCWDLPTIAADSAIVWGSFLHDKQHSGTLPFPRRTVEPPPPPPLPLQYRLAQNYPNPFNQTTVIEVDLPAAGELTVDVFNILGQRVATVFHGGLDAGYYRFEWNGTGSDGRPLASGVYFYRTRLGDQEETRKLVLLK